MPCACIASCQRRRSPIGSDVLPVPPSATRHRRPRQMPSAAAGAARPPTATPPAPPLQRRILWHSRPRARCSILLIIFNIITSLTCYALALITRSTECLAPALSEFSGLHLDRSSPPSPAVRATRVSLPVAVRVCLVAGRRVGLSADTGKAGRAATSPRPRQSAAAPASATSEEDGQLGCDVRVRHSLEELLEVEHPVAVEVRLDDAPAARPSRAWLGATKEQQGRRADLSTANSRVFCTSSSCLCLRRMSLLLLDVVESRLDNSQASTSPATRARVKG